MKEEKSFLRLVSGINFFVKKIAFSLLIMTLSCIHVLAQKQVSDTIVDIDGQFFDLKVGSDFKVIFLSDEEYFRYRALSFEGDFFIQKVNFIDSIVVEEGYYASTSVFDTIEINFYDADDPSKYEVVKQIVLNLVKTGLWIYRTQNDVTRVVYDKRGEILLSIEEEL